MNIKIDLDVINNIILSYNRLSEHQKRVYGVLLGTKNLETYHGTNAIYGFIFEEKKLEEKNEDNTNENNKEEKKEDKNNKNKYYKEKQTFNKISDEMTNN